MSLKTYIITYQKELEYYYGEDFGLESGLSICPNETTDVNIMCLVDTSDRKFSSSSRPNMRRAGVTRRRKIKHRYSYENPLNRIHGYLISENGNNSLTPNEKNIISLTLICSSIFSNKKGIGSDLMNIFIENSTKEGFTDITLEVANDFAWTGHDTEDEDTEDEDTEDEDTEDEDTEDEDTEDEDTEDWYPSEEVLDIISHELWRKSMRKVDSSVPYYNISKEYVLEYITRYLFDELTELDKNIKPISVSDINDPLDTEYFGYWFKKGYRSQLDLLNFYKKFGFYEDPKVHLDWHCYSNIPYPTMICNL